MLVELMCEIGRKPVGDGVAVAALVLYFIVDVEKQ